MLTILFDGIAYGMLLFVLASGLAVTLGLMNFINLAHGAFAMAGGYITVLLVNRLGAPFFADALARLRFVAEVPGSVKTPANWRAKECASPGQRADTQLPSRTTKAARSSSHVSRAVPPIFRLRSGASAGTSPKSSGQARARVTSCCTGMKPGDIPAPSS